ncbi:interferon-induced protein 44-like [Chanodichthys erythropterus]|uniref:interferon-induced protein 44-like n=1 Tax=Chanodichthys erythropterus TaxID=933992 RepID=UPI00351EF98A
MGIEVQGNKGSVTIMSIVAPGFHGALRDFSGNGRFSALQDSTIETALKMADSLISALTTELCKTYKVRNRPGSFFPFTFTDIAGMHSGGIGIKTDDIKKLLNGHIKDGYTFNPVKPITKEDPKYNKNPILKDRIHCLVAVLPANTVSVIDEEMIWQMREVREKARDLGIPQVIVMTKVDEVCPLVKDNLQKIYTSKKIKQKMEECSNSLGVPVSYIYPVKNYHEEHTTNTTVDILILDALKNIVNFANDYVEDQEDS